MSTLPTPVPGPVEQFRRPQLLNADFFIKVGSLVLSFLIVWAGYERFVWPRVAEVRAQARYVSQEEGYVAERSIPIIVKDPEQQAEITIWLWALFLLTLKLWRISQENQLLSLDFLRLEPGERILPEDALTYFKDLKATVESRPGWQQRVLPSVLMAALQRFHATHSIMDAAQSAKERAEIAGNDMEADLSLVKYIAWAIPAIGFIGTVRGIGEALAQAGKAITGDIGGVVDALGLAFNSTLVALLLSMVLMFILHLLQGRQDKLILDLQNYCDEHVVGQMKVPAQETGAPAFQA